MSSQLCTKIYYRILTKQKPFILKILFPNYGFLYSFLKFSLLLLNRTKEEGEEESHEKGEEKHRTSRSQISTLLQIQAAF